MTKLSKARGDVKKKWQLKDITVQSGDNGWRKIWFVPDDHRVKRRLIMRDLPRFLANAFDYLHQKWMLLIYAKNNHSCRSLLVWETCNKIILYACILNTIKQEGYSKNNDTWFVKIRSYVYPYRSKSNTFYLFKLIVLIYFFKGFIWKYCGWLCIKYRSCKNDNRKN